MRMKTAMKSGEMEEGGVGRDEWAPQALISAKLDFAAGPGSMRCRVMIGAAGEG